MHSRTRARISARLSRRCRRPPRRCSRRDPPPGPEAPPPPPGPAARVGGAGGGPRPGAGRRLDPGAAALGGGRGTPPHAPPLCRALRIPRRLDVDGVVLTFDDGPHPVGTPAVLEALAKANA